MTLEEHKEKSSALFEFQLTNYELSYLRNLVRYNIEETSIHRGGKFHKTATEIYSKLCKGYLEHPEITQLDSQYNNIPDRY